MTGDPMSRMARPPRDVLADELEGLDDDRPRASYRDPRRGEICSCGRPASVVYVIAGRVDVGDCRAPNVTPLTPCRDGDCPVGFRVGDHDAAWCTSDRRAERTADRARGWAR